jgi:plasmid stabilization system protein ParE
VRVVLSAAAEADLEEIGDWIAQDNPRRASSFIYELRQCCSGLAEHPLRFELVGRFASRGIRRRVHGNYLIFYLPDETEITVLRVLHGARDFEPLLFPEEDRR